MTGTSDDERDRLITPPTIAQTPRRFLASRRLGAILHHIKKPKSPIPQVNSLERRGALAGPSSTKPQIVKPLDKLKPGDDAHSPDNTNLEEIRNVVRD